MKKVFSGYKYLEWCLEQGMPEHYITEQLYEGWPCECEGLEDEETYYLLEDCWMEEVD